MKSLRIKGERCPPAALFFFTGKVVVPWRNLLLSHPQITLMQLNPSNRLHRFVAVVVLLVILVVLFWIANV